MPVPMEQETISDDALVEAYRSGDECAARVLVERHASALGRFLYGAGAAPAEVEDLVQEAFFRAFRGLAGWRRDASFRTWLLAIGANLLRDEQRRRRGTIVVPVEGHEAPDHCDPEAELAARDAEARLRAGLGKLPRLQREVFLLRAQQGVGYAEIAAALGTTPGAARVHYHHAVKRLKELVQ
jgi:RNA polymerase sigma-70 factor (ECF subfamily)